jgi:hypothetical protein
MQTDRNLSAAGLRVLSGGVGYALILESDLAITCLRVSHVFADGYKRYFQFHDGTRSKNSSNALEIHSFSLWSQVRDMHRSGAFTACLPKAFRGSGLAKASAQCRPKSIGKPLIVFWRKRRAGGPR